MRSSALRIIGPAMLGAVLGLCTGASLAEDTEPGAPIAPDQVPHMKAGLWTDTQVINGGPSMTRTYCDAGRSLEPPRMGDCSRYDLKRTADGAIVADAVCKDALGHETRKTVAYAGDFDAHFTISGDISATEHGETVWVVGGDEFQYLGPCPSGAKPEG